ncbi:MAG: hypothetical protein ACYCUM_12955 [Solirubrobacteraceae bacterium]
MQGLLTVLTGTFGSRVATMPLHVRIEQIRDHVEVAASGGSEAATSQLDVRVHHRTQSITTRPGFDTPPALRGAARTARCRLAGELTRRAARDFYAS